MSTPQPPRADDPDPLIGRTLGGHYRIDARIGGGAMGVVYRAHHTLLDQPFAVKVIASTLADDADVRRRFLVEAKSLTLFAHRHAVQVRHCGEDDGVLYIAMDLVPGESLAALLAREGALPERRAATIAVQVLSALEEAHFAGIVHRDLKPGNVMVETVAGPSAEDRVRVVDFGLARIVQSRRDPPPDGAPSIGGGVVGTVAYMAPEQVNAGSDADGRTDLFAVGVLLYEMATGRRPFAGESMLSTAMAILSQEPAPFPEGGTSAVSPAMRAVIGRALEKDRDRRFQSAGEFADAIRGALAGTAPPAPPDVAPPPPPAGPPPRRVSRAVVVAGSAVVLLAAGLFALFLARGGSGGADRATARTALLDARFSDAAEALGRVVAAGEATPDDRLDRAEARIELADLGAESDLEAAGAVRPRDPRVLLLKARLAWRLQRNFDAAGRTLTELLLVDPGFVEARVERVRMRLAQGRPNDAESDVRAVEADASDSRGPLLRSLLHAARAADPNQSDPGASRALAIASAQRAAALDLRDAEAEVQHATALSGSALHARHVGDHARARTMLEQAETAATEALRRAKADPSFRGQGRAIVRIHSTRGGIRLNREDHPGAKADFDEVLRRSPNDPRARAAALFATRFVDHDAVIDGAEALFKATGDATHLFDVGFAWQMLGLERADVGDIEKAVECYGRAIEAYDRADVLAPRYQATLLYRGETRVLRARLSRGAARTTDLEVARRDLDGALRLVPGDAEVYLRRAAWYTAQGDTANALDDLERAVGDERDRTPRYYQELARALLARAKALAVEGRKAEAKPLLLRVVPTVTIAVERMPDVLPRALPLMGTAEARLAALSDDAEERAAHLAAARARLTALESIARETTGAQAPRLAAFAALLRAEIALAAGDAEGAAREAEKAVSLREAENAAHRWSLDAAWYARLADLLDAAARPDDARSVRARAENLPR